MGAGTSNVWKSYVCKLVSYERNAKREQIEIGIYIYRSNRDIYVYVQIK